MKKILDILTENLTLKEALRIEKTLENEDSHWIVRSLVPIAIATGIFCLLLFSMIVVSILTSNEGQIPNSKEVEDVGLALVFLWGGIVMGFLFSHSDLVGEIRKKTHPIVKDAIDRLSEEENEQESSDRLCVSDRDILLDSGNDNRDNGNAGSE